MKIFITGPSGSGKTTLARLIGNALHLPVTGLDEIIWLPRWQKVAADIRAQREADLISRPAWVIEGVSSTIFAAADIVIFLDVGRATCALRCLRRNWRYLFRSRPGLPENCPEIMILRRQIRIWWSFPNQARPWILEAMASRKDAYVVRGPADLASVLDALGIHQNKLSENEFVPGTIKFSAPSR